MNNSTVNENTYFLMKSEILFLNNKNCHESYFKKAY